MDYRIRDPEQGLLGPVSRDTVLELLKAGVFGPKVTVSVDEGSFLPPYKIDSLSADLEVNTQQKARATYAGDLKRNTAFKILFRFQLNRGNGCLVFRDGGRVKELFFEDGGPIYIASNIPDERIGAYLLRRGIISQAQRHAAGERARGNPSLSFGECLVDLNALSQEVFLRYLREQQMDRMVELCQWRTGTYAFYENRSYGGIRFPLDLNLYDVLLTAARSLDYDRLLHRMRPFAESMVWKQNHVFWDKPCFDFHGEEKEVSAVVQKEPLLKDVARCLGASVEHRTTALAIVYLLWEIDAVAFR